jgi:hypothetical protein
MRSFGKLTPLSLLMLIGLCGCRNQTATAVAAMNDANIKRVANMYAAFQNYKGGRGPADAAELKGFIKDFDQNKLSMMGIDAANVDGVFNSERDGKPFQVRYKVGGGRGSVDAVVFEQDGKDGKKQVGYTGGKVEEVDDATAQQLFSSKQAPPSQPGGTKSGGRTAGRPEGAPTGPAK